MWCKDWFRFIFILIMKLVLYCVMVSSLHGECAVTLTELRVSLPNFSWMWKSKCRKVIKDLEKQSLQRSKHWADDQQCMCLTDSCLSRVPKLNLLLYLFSKVIVAEKLTQTICSSPIICQAFLTGHKVESPEIRGKTLNIKFPEVFRAHYLRQMF